MDNFFIALNQVIIMFALALAGLLLVKLKLLNDASAKTLTNILLYLVTPGVILAAANKVYNSEEAGGFLAALILSSFFYLFNCVFSFLLIRRKGSDNAGVRRFALAMPNAGYIGIPMTEAILGADGVFYVTANIMVFNLFLFSYGRIQLLRDRDLREGTAPSKIKMDKSLLQCILNPASVAAAVGLSFYFSRHLLPPMLFSVANSFYVMNTSLSMLVLGIILARCDLRSALRDWRCAIISFLRLLILPLITMLVLYFADLSFFTADPLMVKSAVLIAFCGPCAVATSFSAVMYGADSVYGSKLVAHSTVLSILTMPLMYYLWDLLPLVFS